MSTYNANQFLEKQLISIVNQTVSKYITLYIRNDGGKDLYIKRLISKWKNKLNIIYIEGENEGPACSFWSLLTNKDIQADYYLFCDQDDIWDRDKVEYSIRVLNDTKWLSFCNCRVIDKNGRVIKKSRVDKDQIFTLSSIVERGAMQGCSMCFTNYFRNYICSLQINYIPMHDFILMLYAIIGDHYVYIEEPLFSYRVHEKNVVAKSNNTIIQIKRTLSNWRNYHNNSISNVAKELLINVDSLSSQERNYITSLAEYKHSLRSKLQILRNVSLKNNFSFFVRVIFNII